MSSDSAGGLVFYTTFRIIYKNVYECYVLFPLHASQSFPESSFVSGNNSLLNYVVTVMFFLLLSTWGYSAVKFKKLKRLEW